MVWNDLVHRHIFGDLLAAEPPVVFIRVVLQVFEAPIRRGFAISHTSMLMPVSAVRSGTTSKRSACCVSSVPAQADSIELARGPERVFTLAKVFD